jgi:hypothetical protein
MIGGWLRSVVWLLGWTDFWDILRGDRAAVRLSEKPEVRMLALRIRRAKLIARWAFLVGVMHGIGMVLVLFAVARISTAVKVLGGMALAWGALSAAASVVLGWTEGRLMARHSGDRTSMGG